MDQQKKHTYYKMMLITYEWSKTWRIDFNKTKCEVLYVGKKNEEINYQMGGITLDKVEQEKDIGVYFDSHLYFDHRINKIILKNQIKR